MGPEFEEPARTIIGIVVRANDPRDRAHVGVERGDAVGHLRERHEHHLVGLLQAPSCTSPTMPTICRGPSNMGPTPLPIMICCPMGSPFGQNCFRHRLIDDDDGGGAGGVALGEVAAAQHGNAEDVEVARRNGVPAAPPLAGPRRPADDLERQPVAALERDAARRAHHLDTRERAEPLAAGRTSWSTPAAFVYCGSVSDIRIVKRCATKNPG